MENKINKRESELDRPLILNMENNMNYRPTYIKQLFFCECIERRKKTIWQTKIDCTECKTQTHFYDCENDARRKSQTKFVVPI